MELSSLKYILINFNLELVIFSLTLGLTYFLIQYYNHWNKRLPPGPWGLPFVGYRPFLDQNMAKMFNELAQKYGQIFGISVGRVYVVVLNDLEHTVEAFRQDASSGRPHEAFYNFSEFEHFGESNGQLWKEHRKCVSGYFRNLFRDDGKYYHLQTILHDEVSHLLTTLSEVDKDTDVDIGDVLSEVTNNTIFRYLFGRSFDKDHPFIRDMHEQQSQILDQGAINVITSYLPGLRFIWRKILPGQIKLKNASKRVEEFIRTEIENHKKVFDPEHPKDFIDLCLLRQQTKENGALYNDGYLNSDVQILLTGGTDTTRMSLKWMFMVMAAYPDVQDKIYQEVKQVFGRDKAPRWEDRYLLPYTMATVMETQRFKTLIPISSVRCAVEDFTVKGYCIPKGASIVSNLWAIHNDEKYWDKPSEFNPEHYLTKDGQLDVNKRLATFSYGKRDCPGKNQAKMELFLFLAGVLQRFKVLPPTNGVSFEENLGLMTCPVKPYVRFQPRT